MGRESTTTADVQRLADIYREHLRRVRWVLRARGIAADEIDDVVHDVFLAIHRRLPAMNDAVEMDTWICGVARSVAFVHRRGIDRRHRATAALPEPDAVRPLDEELARRQAWARLVDVLDELHGDQREAFVLVDVMGMRAAEAATLVGAPVNTLYSRLRLARRHCETRLALPEGVDSSTWLRAAANGELPGPERRDRTWAGIVAALPMTAAKTGLATLVVGGALAVIGTTGVAQIVASPPPPPVATQDHAPPRPRTPATAEPIVPPIADLPTPPPVVASAPAPTPRVPTRDHVVSSPTTTSSAPSPAPSPEPSLDAALELLRTAQSDLDRGDAASALAAIDRYRATRTGGPFERDVLRLERGAACALHDTARATEARDRLAQLGLVAADDPPCR